MAAQSTLTTSKFLSRRTPTSMSSWARSTWSRTRPSSCTRSATLSPRASSHQKTSSGKCRFQCARWCTSPAIAFNFSAPFSASYLSCQDLGLTKKRSLEMPAFAQSGALKIGLASLGQTHIRSLSDILQKQLRYIPRDQNQDHHSLGLRQQR